MQGNTLGITIPLQIQNCKRQRAASKKRKFLPEEDKRLRSLVDKFGAKNWVKIASYLPGRTSRQCRDRWCNYIDPKISNAPWTKQEDQKLMEKYNEIGAHWRVLTSYFPGKSINNVRNRAVKLLKSGIVSSSSFSESSEPLSDTKQEGSSILQEQNSQSYTEENTTKVLEEVDTKLINIFNSNNSIFFDDDGIDFMF